jgi:hypothetical protein
VVSPSTLGLSLSSFDVAQDDPEVLEGSNHEPVCSSFDRYIVSEALILRQAQDER